MLEIFRLFRKEKFDFILILLLIIKKFDFIL